MCKKLYLSQVANYLTSKTGEKHIVIFGTEKFDDLLVGTCAAIVPEQFNNCNLVAVTNSEPEGYDFFLYDKAGNDLYTQAVKVFLWSSDYFPAKDAYVLKQGAIGGVLSIKGVSEITCEIADEIESQSIGF